MESLTVRKVVSLEHALKLALPIVRRQAVQEEGHGEAQGWLFLYEQAAEILIKEAGS